MDREDEDALREILMAWYGPQAQNWPMSESMLSLVMEMIDEMHTCTGVMHFVPQPVGPANALSSLAKSYIKTALKMVKNDLQVYRTCAVSTTLNYKTKVHMASLGL